jgi:hypothetical protein
MEAPDPRWAGEKLARFDFARDIADMYRSGHLYDNLPQEESRQIARNVRR